MATSELDLPGEGGVEPVTVKVGGKPYRLVGMDGPGLAAWMRTVAQKVRNRKKGGVDGDESDFRMYHATLISMCLVDEHGNSVDKDVIYRWPAITQQRLFDKAQEMNGLADPEGEEAKKGSTPTPAAGT